MFHLIVVLCLIDGTRWGSMTPLRQFKGVPQEVLRKAEGKQFVRLHLPV